MITDVLFYATAYVTLFASIFWLTAFFTADRKKAVKPNHPPLSIIVPVYNEGKHIERCLTSLENQRYPGLKILVVDDGSTDGSIEFVDLFVGNADNVTQYRYTNVVEGQTLNVPYSPTDTIYYNFMDSDGQIVNVGYFIYVQNPNPPGNR